MSDFIMVHRPHLTVIEKSAVWGAWIAGGTLFLTVGWMAMEPDDPLGPVSILSRSGAVFMLLQVMGLAGASAAVATILAGRYLPEAGIFATAIGMAAASLRGSTAAQLLLRSAEQPGWSQRMLALKLAGETILWFLVILFAAFVSMHVGRWLFNGERTAGLTGSRRDGIRHFITTGVIGLLAMSVLWAGSDERAIYHGQVCFVVALGVAVGVYVSFRGGTIESPFWSVLAVPAIAILGYLWAGVRPEHLGLPASIPASHFLRPLPIQYVSVGTASAIMTFWYARRRGIGLYKRADAKRAPGR